jgi:hypothetical protein
MIIPPSSFHGASPRPNKSIPDMHNYAKKKKKEEEGKLQTHSIAVANIGEYGIR